MTHQELLLLVISEARDFHGTGDEAYQYESDERYCAELIMGYAAEVGWQIPGFDMQSYIAYCKDEEYPDFFEWFDEYVTVLERLEFEDGYTEQVSEAFVRTEAFKNHIFYELTDEEIRTMDDETLLKIY